MPCQWSKTKKVVVDSLKMIIAVGSLKIIIAVENYSH
jgi:hypothetical protein